MRIVADAQIPLVSEVFSHLGDVMPVSGANLNRAALQHADALLVRSEWRIDRSLLEGSNIRFVGSATSGTDHVDQEYLLSQGIQFADAGGCNSNSVAEYVVTAILFLATSLGIELQGKALGVVGAGRIGSLVARGAEFLGMEVLLNDPPRAEVEGAAGFVAFEALSEADFVTLHVPLTKKGRHPTLDLLCADRIGLLKPSCYLINTSRGAVVEERALKRALGSGSLAGAVLDVWRNEPGIDFDLLEMTKLGTPHIAGYSLDGKLKSTRAIYRALCSFRGVEPQPCPALDQALTRVERTIDLTGARSSLGGLWRAARESYDIDRDGNSLRALEALRPETRAAAFRELRNNYVFRPEFVHSRVVVKDRVLARALAGLGFTVEAG